MGMLAVAKDKLDRKLRRRKQQGGSGVSPLAASDPVTGLYYERARWYRTGQAGLRQEPKSRYTAGAVNREISQDPLSYINGANTYQFVMSNPVDAADPTGEYWGESWVNGVGSAIGAVGSTIADATGINGGAVAGAFWAGAAHGAQGGSSIVADTLTFGGTDYLGVTSSSQYQGGAYTLSRDFAQAGRTGLELAATGGIAGAAMRGAASLGATGIIAQAAAAGTASAAANGGFQALNNIGAGQAWTNGLPEAAATGFVGGFIGGGLNAARAASLAAALDQMSVGMENMMRGFLDMNPQLAQDMRNSATLGNFMADLGHEAAAKSGEWLSEWLWGGAARGRSGNCPGGQ